MLCSDQGLQDSLHGIAHDGTAGDLDLLHALQTIRTGRSQVKEQDGLVQFQRMSQQPGME